MLTMHSPASYAWFPYRVFCTHVHVDSLSTTYNQTFHIRSRDRVFVNNELLFKRRGYRNPFIFWFKCPRFWNNNLYFLEINFVSGGCKHQFWCIGGYLLCINKTLVKIDINGLGFYLNIGIANIERICDLHEKDGIYMQVLIQKTKIPYSFL